MTGIFYFIGFIISISLLPGLFKYKSIVNIRRNYGTSSNTHEETIIRKDDISDYIHVIKYATSSIVAVCWILIGLLSNNWLMFLCALIIYFILYKSFSAINGKSKFSLLLKDTSAIFLLIFLFIFCLFISVNHFYFKYDLEPIIKKLLITS